MKFGRSYKNQSTKFYLQKWYQLERDIEHLGSLEMVQAKILYSSLKILNHDELEFLAAKYRKEKRPWIADPILAEDNGMKIHAYRQKRGEIESKLNVVLLENLEFYRDELSKAISLERNK